MTTEFKPCPHCDGEYLIVFVDRLRIAYVECSECGAKMEIDCSHCNDPTVGMLIDSLCEKWNRRGKK